MNTTERMQKHIFQKIHGFNRSIFEQFKLKSKNNMNTNQKISSNPTSKQKIVELDETMASSPKEISLITSSIRRNDGNNRWTCVPSPQKNHNKLKTFASLPQKFTKSQQVSCKMLPDLKNRSIQKQLREIDLINGKIVNFNKIKFESNESLVQSEKKYRIKYCEQQIFKKYWNKMEEENKMSKNCIEKIQEHRLNKVFKKYINLPAELLPQNTNQENQGNCNNFAQSILKSHFLPILQKIEKEKTDFLTIPKQIVEKENAHKIYSLIKGGYALDPSDVGGEEISLKKFNQDKESFIVLNDIYTEVMNSLNISKAQTEDLNDQTFSTLVSINQLNGKVAPGQLLRIMKANKIVK